MGKLDNKCAIVTGGLWHRTRHRATACRGRRSGRHRRHQRRQGKQAEAQINRRADARLRAVQCGACGRLSARGADRR